MQVVNNQSRIHAEQNTDQFSIISTNTTLTANQLVVHAVNLVGTDLVIKLPPVSEAAGKIYTIHTVDATGNGVDVISQGDHLYATTETINLAAAVAIDAVGDYLCVMSNGISWMVLTYNIA